MDLIKECNDKGLLSEKDFVATFCNYCKNRKCERAGWSKTNWDERISTQWDRLIANPNILLNKKGTQWDGLSDFELIQSREPIEVWDVTPTQQTLQIEDNSPELPAPALVLIDPPRQEAQPEQPVVEGGRLRLLNTEVKDFWLGTPEVENKPQPKTQDPWEVPVKVGSTFKMGR